MVVSESIYRAARLLRAACISTMKTGRMALRIRPAMSRAEAGGAVAMALLFGAAIAHAAVGGAVPGVAVGERTTPPRATVKAAVVNPNWSELSVVQQQALLPLATEWDKLDAAHKSKWLEISRRSVTMKPGDQARIQERMRAWVSLTPEQRRVARESYARTKKLNTDQKSAQWQQYQQLPEEQKKTLAAEAAKNKVAALPPVHSRPKTVAPIKSSAKPILQQSVLPKPAVARTAAPVPGVVSAPMAVPPGAVPAAPAAVPSPTPGMPVPSPSAAAPVAVGVAPADR